MFHRAVAPLAQKKPSEQPPAQRTPFRPRMLSRSQQQGSEALMNGSSGEPYTLAAFLNDLRPSRAELYSILSFVLTWVGSLLCFVPVYYNGVNGYVPSEISLRRNFKGSVLEQSVNSEQYQTALLLRWVWFRCFVASALFHVSLLRSVIIAVPMLVDILLDAYYVFRFRSGRKLHWFARFWLLCRYYSSPLSVCVEI